MDLLDHIAAAQNLREISRLLNSVIVKFGRQGIIARGPHGDLQKCFNLILKARDKAGCLCCSQYPGNQDIYFRHDGYRKAQVMAKSLPADSPGRGIEDIYDHPIS